jgi:hypothetical protein
MEAKKKLNQRMVTEEELTESVLSSCLFPTRNKKKWNQARKKMFNRSTGGLYLWVWQTISKLTTTY